jgi:hypothetical protein
MRSLTDQTRSWTLPSAALIREIGFLTLRET